MPPKLDTSLIELLSQVETATVGHFLHSCFIDPSIRAVLTDVRIAGTAVTIQLPNMDGTIMHYAVGIARPGDILVVDRCGDRRHACWGGLVTHAARQAGVVGGIIDGVATDFPELRSMRMPLWCRGPSPLTCKKIGIEGAVNVPVSIGGVVVEPGDAIVADESGVLVMKPGEAEAIARRALEMQANEIKLIARLRAGERLADLTGATTLIEERNRIAGRQEPSRCDGRDES